MLFNTEIPLFLAGFSYFCNEPGLVPVIMNYPV